MAGVNRLTGTAWHVERFERQEGDDRRHRSRCVNYKGRPDGYCSYYCVKCRGAAHCSHYAEKAVEQDEVTAPTVAKKTSAAVTFKGIKELKLSEIVVDKMFINRPPKEKKISEVIEYYKKHGELDKPIVVSIENGKYKLQDKYLRFVVAKKLGLETVPAEMGTEEEIKERDAIRRVGTLVWQQKHAEVGEVIEASLSKVTIKYDDGRERTYDIHMALETKNIRVL